MDSQSVTLPLWLHKKIEIGRRRKKRGEEAVARRLKVQPIRFHVPQAYFYAHCQGMVLDAVCIKTMQMDGDNDMYWIANGMHRSTRKKVLMEWCKIYPRAQMMEGSFPLYLFHIHTAPRSLGLQIYERPQALIQSTQWTVGPPMAAPILENPQRDNCFFTIEQQH